MGKDIYRKKSENGGKKKDRDDRKYRENRRPCLFFLSFESLFFVYALKLVCRQDTIARERGNNNKDGAFIKGSVRFGELLIYYYYMSKVTGGSIIRWIVVR